MKRGIVCSRRAAIGSANASRTRSVSMNPKYAIPALAPCGASSVRRARPSASTPALLIAYGAAHTPFRKA